MKIEVFGVGCAKCVSLEKNVREALKQTGIKADVEKVTDIEKMVMAGVMSTPALAIDSKIVAAGRPLSVQDIITLIRK